MIYSIINNILEKMEVASRKLSTSSTMRIPISIIVMLNSVNDCQKRFLKLCGSTEAMVSSGMKGIDTDETMVDLENCQKNALGTIIESLMKVMDTTLNKLGRYDEGSLTKTFLSFTKPSMDTANAFIQVLLSPVSYYLTFSVYPAKSRYNQRKDKRRGCRRRVFRRLVLQKKKRL